MQIRELYHPGVVYAKLMELMGRLAELGLVHCDFNEFNVLVRAPMCTTAKGHEPPGRVSSPSLRRMSESQFWTPCVSQTND